MNRVVLDLPIPPSSNNLFPTGSHGKRYRSPEYKVWLNAAGYELLAQRPAKIKGRVAVSYDIARFSDKRRHDIANLEKASGDLLVEHQVIEDDSLIERLVMAWSNDLPEGRMRVTLEAWNG